ncbi:MAG: 2Fe-2S iron-sulfur cluster binding domain-containing protein [Sphaerospermopsis sp. SIO1G2]|nr:2Fe-2S iron-sulfur cluster binding domain-containing protein [Sphaerospermopsis sp. SIO1G1]NET72685.1 2Fe-2S iron-sulfur cluster binding domain-containing protein [Sphaerospermopsis sp. SIO1G2]
MVKLSFPGSGFQDINLQVDDRLSECLTVQNSPVLFGCRTGICGTCLVEVVGDVLPPEVDELEMLEILAPNNQKARLACQIEIMSDVEITLIK